MVARSDDQIQQGGYTETEYHGKRASCSFLSALFLPAPASCSQLQESLWRGVIETICWHISRIKWNHSDSLYTREWGAKMPFSYLMVSFSRAVLPGLILFQVGDQKRGKEAWAGNCPWIRGESSLSFSLELVTWRPPFPSASWRYSPTCQTPKLVTGGRSGGGCLALVPFILKAVVTANIYLPMWNFRGWTPGYKKQIQLRAVCALHIWLNS